jgi:hypothetical protein
MSNLVHYPLALDLPCSRNHNEALSGCIVSWTTSAGGPIGRCRPHHASGGESLQGSFIVAAAVAPVDGTDACGRIEARSWWNDDADCRLLVADFAEQACAQ